VSLGSRGVGVVSISSDSHDMYLFCLSRSAVLLWVGLGGVRRGGPACSGLAILCGRSLRHPE
jgi:hypothetical protein